MCTYAKYYCYLYGLKSYHSFSNLIKLEFISWQRIKILTILT